MPDISMCDGDGCEMKDNCYRFKAEPNFWRQSYFMNAPWIEYEGRQVCTSQWPMEENKKNDNAAIRLRPNPV
jgi:hypothetical protein